MTDGSDVRSNPGDEREWIEGLLAEVSRLEADVADLREVADANFQARGEETQRRVRAEAEVERLREGDPELNARLVRAMDAARAEVERLREDQQTYADTYARNMKRVRAENDLLRNAIRHHREQILGREEGARISSVAADRELWQHASGITAHPSGSPEA